MEINKSKTDSFTEEIEKWLEGFKSAGIVITQDDLKSQPKTTINTGEVDILSEKEKLVQKLIMSGVIDIREALILLDSSNKNTHSNPVPMIGPYYGEVTWTNSSVHNPSNFA